MDIFLSVNNREEILQIPIMPSSFTVSKPQGTEKFETVSGEEIMLIGSSGLKSIAFESFFPIRDYPYIHHKYNPDMWGWDYVYMIDTWIEKKLPIRLIITYERKDTPINIAVAVTSFEYTIKTDGDLWYKIEFGEFNLLGHETIVPWYDEEAIFLEELEKLKEQVKYLSEIVQELTNPFIYDYIDDNMPIWARAAVRAAVNRKCLSGEDGEKLQLDYKDLRHITILHRAGVLEFIYNYVDDNMPEWASEWVQKAIDKGYLTPKSFDESGKAMYNLTAQDLRLITIMGKAGLFD